MLIESFLKQSIFYKKWIGILKPDTVFQFSLENEMKNKYFKNKIELD